MLLAPLLRLQDETRAFVEVDASRAARAVAVMESNDLFKNVDVLVLIRLCGFGPGHSEHLTKLGEEGVRTQRARRCSASKNSSNGFLRLHT
jgi:hypothetical protein